MRIPPAKSIGKPSIISSGFNIPSIPPKLLNSPLPMSFILSPNFDNKPLVLSVAFLASFLAFSSTFCSSSFCSSGAAPSRLPSLSLSLNALSGLNLWSKSNRISSSFCTVLLCIPKLKIETPNPLSAIRLKNEPMPPIVPMTTFFKKPPMATVVFLTPLPNFLILSQPHLAKPVTLSATNLPVAFARFHVLAMKDWNGLPCLSTTPALNSASVITTSPSRL